MRQSCSRLWQTFGQVARPFMSSAAMLGDRGGGDKKPKGGVSRSGRGAGAAPEGKEGEKAKKGEGDKKDSSAGKDAPASATPAKAAAKKKKVKVVEKRKFNVLKLLKSKPPLVATKREDVPEWFVKLCNSYNDGTMWDEVLTPEEDGRKYFRRLRRERINQSNAEAATKV